MGAQDEAGPYEALMRGLGIIEVWHGETDDEPTGHWESLDPPAAADRVLAVLADAGYRVVHAPQADQ